MKRGGNRICPSCQTSSRNLNEKLLGVWDDTYKLDYPSASDICWGILEIPVMSSGTYSDPERPMKSVINVLADCEVYECIVTVKSLIQKIRPDLWDILTLFQTIFHVGAWETAGPHIFEVPIEPTSFSV
jgi:hypothetical protein